MSDMQATTLQKNKNKEELDELLRKLNSYHQNVMFTVEEKPDHFLDTAFDYSDEFNCRVQVYQKPGKLTTHWKSHVPTGWKWSCILGDLHRAK